MGVWISVGVGVVALGIAIYLLFKVSSISSDVKSIKKILKDNGLKAKDDEDDDDDSADAS